MGGTRTKTSTILSEKKKWQPRVTEKERNSIWNFALDWESSKGKWWEKKDQGTPLAREDLQMESVIHGRADDG